MVSELNLVDTNGIGPILDSTLRDGRYLGNWRPDVTSSLVAKLAACGVSGIELGPELGLGDTSSNRFDSRELIFEDIASASLVKSQSLIGSFFIPGVGVRDDLVRAKENGLDFIRIGQNPTTWTSAVELIEVAISLGLRVFFNLMKSHLVSPHEFAKIAGTLSELPLDGIYLVDSTGTLTPDDVRAYILEAREYTSRALGFHGHDNLGLAHANSLMAWNCGAIHVDGTLMGIGRGGGNASTEQLSGLRKKVGLADAIDTSSLCRVSFELSRELERQDDDFAYLDIVCGIFGFHSSWLTTVREIAETYGVASDEVIAEVAAMNRENPARELFEQVAQAIASRSVS